MALPRVHLAADEFSDELSYFGARLAADNKVASLAPEIRDWVQKVDDAHTVHRKAKRAEVEARASRDFADEKLDDGLQDLSRELRATTGRGHVLLELVFPDPVSVETGVTGVEQVNRTRELLGRMELALNSPQLERDSNAGKIARVLLEGKAAVQADLQRLDEANAPLALAVTAVEDSRLRLHDCKAQALVVAGGVIGKLRGLVGSEEAAYSYTRSSSKRAAKPSEETPAAS